MKIFPNQTLGFSLVETVLVIAVLGILSVLSLANYQEYNDRQIFKNEVLNLRSNLKAVQNKALSGVKDCSVCGGIECGGVGSGKRLEGWEINFTSARSYNIYGMCGGSVFQQKTYSLSNNALFSPIPTPNIVRFKPLGQGTNLTSDLDIIVNRSASLVWEVVKIKQANGTIE